MNPTPSPDAPLVVLAAGGTGGHVFPAEALAQELLAQDYRLALITDSRGDRYGGTLGLIDKHSISAGALAGHGIVGKLISSARLSWGLVQAYQLMKRLKPAVVVGFGGYAAAPTVAAALMAGVPTVIHEQNAILGWANRKLAARVTKVCTSFDLAKPAPSKAQVIRTGLPVRPAVAAVRSTPYHAPHADEPFRILVLGGSQGARIFSDVLPAAVALLPEAFRHTMEISQQCRPEEITRTQAAYANLGTHVELRHFFDNVPELMAKSHLLIARAGASTVAEVTLAGRPSVLVPYPYAADDHQTANAKVLATVGGTWMMPQDTFTPRALADQLILLREQTQLLTDAASNARAFSIPDAAGRMAAVVEGIAHGKNGARAGRHVSTTSVSATVQSMNASNSLDRRILSQKISRGAA
jgi:UDP-N-acetylglucosamine--N-acetylmuramyl-(pentapeptide) pyrophosphoryl-undecaprenol N-acetylglucosamine transferase